jgi:hypothetical protein
MTAVRHGHPTRLVGQRGAVLALTLAPVLG